MNLNFNKLIVSMIPFLITITLALAFTRVLYTTLPKQSIEHIESNNKSIKFSNYNYINSFGLNKTKQTPTKKIVQQEYLIDQNLILQAIYLLNKNDGFAVIQEKSTRKTQTLAKNEYFKEYKLIQIESNFVVFQKQNKHYKLYMENTKSKDNKIVRNNYQQVIEEKPVIIDKGQNNYALQKSDLLSYSKDLKKIWSDIGIRSFKQEGKMVGFRIYKLNNKSVFNDLGLKVNDILIKANNVELNNYQNAFKLYKMMDKTDLMQLTILRNNKEMEITYEIE